MWTGADLWPTEPLEWCSQANNPAKALHSLSNSSVYKSNIMDRIFEGSLVQQQLKLLCHQAMTGEAIVNGPNYRSSLSFPIRFLKRSMFSHNYFSLLMRGVKTWRQEIRFSLMLSKKLCCCYTIKKSAGRDGCPAD